MSTRMKKVSESQNVMNELVLPNDTNTFTNLMGGRLMYWMDIAAAFTAAKHSGSSVVTVSVDNISFKNPIKLGHYVHIEAMITRAFTSSMEIYLRVTGEDTLLNQIYPSNEAYFTFVALDTHGKPKAVPEVLIETEEEQERFNGALRRRQLRLVLAGKMSPKEAVELKAIFN